MRPLTAPSARDVSRNTESGLRKPLSGLPTPAACPFLGSAGRCYGLPMLGPGDRVPDVRVWTAPGEEAVPLRQVLGSGLSLLLFYLWDWSPT